jgi:hypothetical protein
MVALFAFRIRDKTHKIRKIPTNTRHFRSAFRLSSGRQAAVFRPKIAPLLACPGEQIVTSSLMGAVFGDSGCCIRKRQGRLFSKSMPHGRPFSGADAA